ncbi:CAP domain-containing protein [Bacillus sp. T3]|uniref:CAP domain-containing protein n=1 Tax=Bacillus sp. T3 TaxID=467262 RepID=UPI002981E5D2|nr:CAP domain-containing protein [Bacillus sp. T3]
MKFVKITMSSFILVVLSLFFTESLNAISKYKIKQGDTLWKISMKHHIPLNELLLINHQLENPELIYPGQFIFIPDQKNKHSLSMEQEKLLTYINDERRKKGLRPFIFDPILSEIAEKKSLDMLEHQYVAHTSPTYGNPTHMLETFRIPYKQAFENIGAGPNSSKDMFQTWMNSQVNRRHILEKNAIRVGVGYAKGGLHGNYWTLIIIEN